MFLLLVAAFVVEVPPSIGISNASVGIMREEMKTAGSKTKIGTGLKAEDEGKISGEEQIAATISSIFGDLGEPDHRRSFALMKRIRGLPSFIFVLLKATGYQIGAGMQDLVTRASFALRLALIIVPGQTSNGVKIPFTVRFSRVVSLSDNDTKIELQAHSVTGKDHDFALKIGMRFYVFSCSGLFMAKVKREIRVAKVGNTTLRDARIFLLKGDDQAENPSAVAATRAFVLSSAPYDASANRVTNKDETQTETYEVQSGSSKTPLGTSSSPVTARMGTGLAIGGVTGTSGGKVYVQFIKQGTMPHCTLQRVADTSALSSALYCLATSASDQAKPSYFGALTSGRTYKGGSKAKEQASAIEDLDIETLAEELSSEKAL